MQDEKRVPKNETKFCRPTFSEGHGACGGARPLPQHLPIQCHVRALEPVSRPTARNQPANILIVKQNLAQHRGNNSRAKFSE